MGVFPIFLNCTNGTKLCKMSHSRKFILVSQIGIFSGFSFKNAFLITFKNYYVLARQDVYHNRDTNNKVVM